MPLLTYIVEFITKKKITDSGKILVDANELKDFISIIPDDSRCKVIYADSSGLFGTETHMIGEDVKSGIPQYLESVWQDLRRHTGGIEAARVDYTFYYKRGKKGEERYLELTFYPLLATLIINGKPIGAFYGKLRRTSLTVVVPTKYSAMREVMNRYNRNEI